MEVTALGASRQTTHLYFLTEYKRGRNLHALQETLVRSHLDHASPVGCMSRSGSLGGLAQWGSPDIA